MVLLVDQHKTKIAEKISDCQIFWATKIPKLEINHLNLLIYSLFLLIPCFPFYLLWNNCSSSALALILALALELETIIQNPFKFVKHLIDFFFF